MRECVHVYFDFIFVQETMTRAKGYSGYDLSRMIGFRVHSFNATIAKMLDPDKQNSK